MNYKLFLPAAVAVFFTYIFMQRYYSPSRSQIVRVENLSQFEISGKYRYTVRLVLTDLGPLRLPWDRELGYNIDSHKTIRSELMVGCNYELQLSQEPKDTEFAIGNYNLILKAHREHYIGRIDRVVRKLTCN
jgi:hypothetical protein